MKQDSASLFTVSDLIKEQLISLVKDDKKAAGLLFDVFVLTKKGFIK